MRKILSAILPCMAATILYAVSASSASAQANPAAFQRQLSLTGGVMASGFHTDYATNDPLFGPGAFVDLHLTHWVQIEAEGRWMRWNSYYGEHQSNYLIGPRVPIKHFGKFDTYGKVLIGGSNMDFPAGDYYSHGNFFTIAFGGTLEYHVNRRWSVKMPDFEYQDWPKFIPSDPYVAHSPNMSLQPLGFSVGVGYRIF